MGTNFCTRVQAKLPFNPKYSVLNEKEVLSFLRDRLQRQACDLGLYVAQLHEIIQRPKFPSSYCSTAKFFKFNIFDILGQLIFVIGGCPVQYWMFSSIFYFYLLDTVNTSLVKTNKHVSRHYRMSYGEQITPGRKTLLYSILDSSSSMWSKQILIHNKKKNQLIKIGQML